jgi:WD repeat-containing protein mio
MVVNKDGDLELYAVHDVPKHVIWSSRGDIAITAGQTLRILPGFNQAELSAEPWDAAARRESQHLDVRSRGRSKPRDDDVFLALNSTVSSNQVSANLAATRPGKARTYSSAALRKYNYRFEHSGNEGRREGATASGDITSRANGENPRGRNPHSHRAKNQSRGKDQTLKIMNHVMENDISMTMRHRVVGGYGLDNVRPFSVRNEGLALTMTSARAECLNLARKSRKC